MTIRADLLTQSNDIRSDGNSAIRDALTSSGTREEEAPQARRKSSPHNNARRIRRRSDALPLLRDAHPALLQHKRPRNITFRFAVDPGNFISLFMSAIK